jgi:hypothetical protein
MCDVVGPLAVLKIAARGWCQEKYDFFSNAKRRDA